MTEAVGVNQASQNQTANTPEPANSDSSSFNSLIEQKNSLTSEVREAGISEKDEAFMDNFSEEMIQKKNEKNKQSLAQDKAKDNN